MVYISVSKFVGCCCEVWLANIMGPHSLQILVADASNASFQKIVHKVSYIPVEIEEVESMPEESAGCELEITEATRLNKRSASSPIRPRESMIEGRNAYAAF